MSLEKKVNRAGNFVINSIYVGVFLLTAGLTVWGFYNMDKCNWRRGIDSNITSSSNVTTSYGVKKGYDVR